MDKTKDLSNNELEISHLLKVNEVAEILNISRSNAYALMQGGEIPTVRIGKEQRIRPKDLIQYIKNNTYG